MNKSHWTEFLKSAAMDAGFDQVAFCAAKTPATLPQFHQWLEKGFHGEMEYLSNRRPAYAHPKSVLENCKSIMMLTTNYRSSNHVDSYNSNQGRISCYAWGSVDYHDLIHVRMKQIAEAVNWRDPTVQVRGVIDTAPMLEREFAQLAGIGWFGKNTMLISKQSGSYFFLACFLLDIELDYDQPFVTDHCGTCTACLEACPTKAFPEPGTLDATRCISYLTIEHRSAIPLDLREQLGEWIFGCDVCQDVCPWNRNAPVTDQPPFAPSEQSNPVDLFELFFLSEAEFRSRFRKTPLWRAKRRGLLRNAAIALGNRGDASAVKALKTGLHDDEPLIRGASVWALGKIAQRSKDGSLQNEIEKIFRRLVETESSGEVISELQLALGLS